MSNPATLKPFGKGHDPRRNLRGRPKGAKTSLQKIIERELKREVLVYGKKTPTDVAILIRLIEDAHKGKLEAVRVLFNYMYGKPIAVCPSCNYFATKAARKALAEEKRRDEEEMIADARKRAKKMLDSYKPKNLNKSHSR